VSVLFQELKLAAAQLPLQGAFKHHLNLVLLACEYRNSKSLESDSQAVLSEIREFDELSRKLDYYSLDPQFRILLHLIEKELSTPDSDFRDWLEEENLLPTFLAQGWRNATVLFLLANVLKCRDFVKILPIMGNEEEQLDLLLYYCWLQGFKSYDTESFLETLGGFTSIEDSLLQISRDLIKGGLVSEQALLSENGSEEFTFIRKIQLGCIGELDQEFVDCFESSPKDTFRIVLWLILQGENRAFRDSSWKEIALSALDKRVYEQDWDLIRAMMLLFCLRRGEHGSAGRIVKGFSSPEKLILALSMCHDIGLFSKEGALMSVWSAFKKGFDALEEAKRIHKGFQRLKIMFLSGVLLGLLGTGGILYYLIFVNPDIFKIH